MAIIERAALPHGLPHEVLDEERVTCADIGSGMAVSEFDRWSAIPLNGAAAIRVPRNL